MLLRILYEYWVNRISSIKFWDFHWNIIKIAWKFKIQDYNIHEEYKWW